MVNIIRRYSGGCRPSRSQADDEALSRGVCNGIWDGVVYSHVSTLSLQRRRSEDRRQQRLGVEHSEQASSHVLLCAHRRSAFAHRIYASVQYTHI
jgi:hypothetical protein